MREDKARRKAIGIVSDETLRGDVALERDAVRPELTAVAGGSDEKNVLSGFGQDSPDVPRDGFLTPRHRRHGPVLAREIAVELQSDMSGPIDAQQARQAGVRCKLMCTLAPNFDPYLEWAPRGGQVQAAGLTASAIKCFQRRRPAIKSHLVEMLRNEHRAYRATVYSLSNRK
jgi:hypothetical protein